MHNIRQPVAGIVFAIVLICLAPMAAARSFLSTIADVPLADGLHELPDAGFVFDKPQGRIVHNTPLRLIKNKSRIGQFVKPVG